MAITMASNHPHIKKFVNRNKRVRDMKKVRLIIGHSDKNRSECFSENVVILSELETKSHSHVTK